LIEKAVAERYAMALFQAAQDNGQLDQVMADYQLVISFLKQDPRLGDLLRHQRLSARRKKEVARELWHDRISGLFWNYLALVIDKHRERYLEAIYDDYAGLMLQLHNVVVAEVRTAFPLGGQAELLLTGALEKLTGKKIELTTVLRPELIGGLAVKIGDRILDGSIATRLSLLGMCLAGRSRGELEAGM
jgi:F-type H+-transporting ATPase subunit delta